jgi:predicted nucleic acid-binding protein
VIVVDASVWVSALLPEDVHHLVSERWVANYLLGGNMMVAPVLLLAEVAGAIRRRSGEPTFARQAIADLRRLPLLRLIAIDGLLARSAAQLAIDYGLRGVDAVYVATAHALNLPLVTWDREQRARAVGVVATWAPHA